MAGIERIHIQSDWGNREIRCKESQDLEPTADGIYRNLFANISMPLEEGEVVHECTKDVAIILLTARSIASYKVMGLSVGAYDYIVKPFDSVELSARVESVLLRSAQRRDLSPLTQEASVNATEMKTYAKRQDKSGNEIDRRTKEE